MKKGREKSEKSIQNIQRDDGMLVVLIGRKYEDWVHPAGANDTRGVRKLINNDRMKMNDGTELSRNKL